MIYFTSDLHFGNKNILSLDNRPFLTIEDNDETLIKNWNETVNIDDEVYILGDVSWYSVTKTIEILKSLNGIKHLIIGNHDSKLVKNKDFRDLFVEVTEYKQLSLQNGLGVILCHYPIPCFKNHYSGWYHFYGHVHSSFEENMMQHTRLEMEELYMIPCNMINVGCMNWNYTPVSIDELIK